MVENEYGHKIEWHHVECFVATKKGSGIKASANNSLMAEARRSWTLHWEQWCHRPLAMIRARPARAGEKAAAQRKEANEEEEEVRRHSDRLFAIREQLRGAGALAIRRVLEANGADSHGGDVVIQGRLADLIGAAAVPQAQWPA